MDAKTNVTSGLTTPYENALLRSTEKTNPIKFSSNERNLRVNNAL
jgi:hypothetical protein